MIECRYRVSNPEFLMIQNSCQLSIKMDHPDPDRFDRSQVSESFLKTLKLPNSFFQNSFHFSGVHHLRSVLCMPPIDLY